VNEQDLGGLLARSVDERVRGLRPRPDFEALLGRLEHRQAHRRRQWIGAVVVAACIGVGVGALLASGSDRTSRTLLPADGLPRAQPPTATFQPADAAAARTAVSDAFHDAFDGQASPASRFAATQDAKALESLTAASLKRAKQFGYTPEELSGTTIDVLDVSFIDETHAIAKFTLVVPGHGAVLVDRIGYAVLDHGRWKVALRTSCDLLSLTGIGQECPPSS
jgi:hypothetical protein